MFLCCAAVLVFLLQHPSQLCVVSSQTGKLHVEAGELEAAEAAFAKASTCAAALHKLLAAEIPEATREEAATELVKLYLARTDIAWRLQQSVGSH